MLHLMLGLKLHLMLGLMPGAFSRLCVSHEGAKSDASLLSSYICIVVI